MLERNRLAAVCAGAALGQDAMHGVQVGSVQVLHRDEELVVGLAGDIDVHQVGMLQRGRDARLVEEHGEELVALGQLRQDALDHHVLLEPARPRHAREIDLGHAADRELPQQPVPPQPLWPQRSASIPHRQAAPGYTSVPTAHRFLAAPSRGR